MFVIKAQPVKLNTYKIHGEFQMSRKRPKKTYPPFYERFIPVAIGLLAIVIIGMLVFTIAVGIGVLKFG
jgi:hypothetical protein